MPGKTKIKYQCETWKAGAALAKELIFSYLITQSWYTMVAALVFSSNITAILPLKSVALIR